MPFFSLKSCFFKSNFFIYFLLRICEKNIKIKCILEYSLKFFSTYQFCFNRLYKLVFWNINMQHNFMIA